MAIDYKTHRIYLSDADFAPPPAGESSTSRRPRILPDTFGLLVVAPQ